MPAERHRTIGIYIVAVLTLPAPLRLTTLGTIAVRVPADLIEKVKKYASVHRCSVSELIRDGLEMRLESGEVPGRSVWLAQENGETSPSPDTGDTVLQEMFPMLHAAIQTTLREAIHTVLPLSQGAVQALPHGEHGESVIQQSPISVLQQDPGESQPAAEALAPESTRLKTPEGRQPVPADDPVSQYGAGFDHEKFYLGRLCPKGHRYGDSGLSLLRKHNNGCRECENAQKRERRARQKAAQEG